MHQDVEACVRAVRAKDPRFDGWFFTAVVTTGIYCRPSCPAASPKAQNMRFHPSAAAAQLAGFRACRRCRPDASPGAPQWQQRADLVGRAMRLIADGIIDREGVAGLVSRLGCGSRRLEQELMRETGAGPIAIARAQRAQTARLLIGTTAMPLAEVAFAAGFSSRRAMDATVRRVFEATAAQLRSRDAPGRMPSGPGALRLRLPFRAPLCPDNLFGHLVATGVPGVEEWRAGAYRRTLRLPHGHGVVGLRPLEHDVEAGLELSDLRDLAVAISRCRRLLDLDADPAGVDELLGRDPTLRPHVDRAPGRRVPRTVDPAELAIRAVLGQQVSTAAARTHAGRLVLAHGEPVTDPGGGLTHLFPAPQDLAAMNPADLAMPQSRRRSLAALVDALASGDLDLGPGSDWRRARAQLGVLPGIGPWTIETVAMRGLGDPDAFIPTDLGVRLGAGTLGLPTTPAALTAYARRWQPWRAYAVQHLWATGDHPINRLPREDAA